MFSQFFLRVRLVLWVPPPQALPSVQESPCYQVYHSRPTGSQVGMVNAPAQKKKDN